MSGSPVVLVLGTHGDEEAWWKADSPFGQALRASGHVLLDPLDPFVWSGDLDGTLLDNVLGRVHRDWMAGGHALAWYVRGKQPPIVSGPPPRVHVIAHSHGGQIALYAAYYGLAIDTLVTVATPVRRDMRAIARGARPQIATWIHMHTDGTDWWQVLGGRTFRRRMELADRNVLEPGVGHSGLLNPLLWTERGWWSWLAR